MLAVNIRTSPGITSSGFPWYKYRLGDDSSLRRNRLQGRDTANRPLGDAIFSRMVAGLMLIAAFCIH